MFFIFFFTSFLTKSQTQFISQYKYNQSGNRYKIKTFSDGNLLIFESESNSLIKLNQCGDVIWSKIFEVDSNTQLQVLEDILISTTNQIYILTRIGDPNYKTHIIKLNTDGGVIWNKTYSDTLNFNHFTYNLQEDLDGNIISYSNISNNNTNPNYNLLIKINTEGDIVWSKKYNYGFVWGENLATSDNGFLFREGLNFNKVDDDGEIEWTNITNGNYYYYKPIEVSDGYIYTSTDSFDKIRFSKINLNGEAILSEAFLTNYSLQPLNLVLTENNTLVTVFNTGYKPFIVEFNQNLEVINEFEINLNFQATSIEVGINNLIHVVGFDIETNLITTSLLLDSGSTCLIDSSNIFISNDTNVANNNSTAVSNHILTPEDIDINLENIDVEKFTFCESSSLVNLNLGNDTSICYSNSFTLKNLSTYIFDSYNWSTEDTSKSISVSQSGSYILEGFFNCGEESIIDTIKVTFLNPTKVDIPLEVSLCDSNSRRVFLPECDNCNYLWSNGDTTFSTTISSDSSVLHFKFTDEKGCVKTDTIDLNCICTFELPNIITPNNDKINDVLFENQNIPFISIHVTIYNRWGMEILSSLDYTSINFDNLSDGNYFYKVNYTNYCKESNSAKGWFQISR